MIKKRVHSIRIKTQHKYGTKKYEDYMIGDAKYTDSERDIPSLIDWWQAEKAWLVLWRDMGKERQQEFYEKPSELKPALRTNMINEKIMDTIPLLKSMYDKHQEHLNDNLQHTLHKVKLFIDNMKALVFFRKEYPEARYLCSTVQRARYSEHIRVYKDRNFSKNINDWRNIEEIMPEMISPVILLVEPHLKKAKLAQRTASIWRRLKENKDVLETKRKKYEESLARLEEVQNLPDDWEGKQKELEDWKNAAPDWVGKVQISSRAINAHRSVTGEKESAERRLKWDKEYYENCMKAIANGTAYLAERGIVLEEEE